MVQFLRSESSTVDPFAGPEIIIPSVLGEHPTGAPLVDTVSMIRKASTPVNLHHLLKSGKKDIFMISREKIDGLIRQAVRNMFENNRLDSAFVAPSSWRRMEAEARQEFEGLRGQYEQTAQAREDLVLSKRGLDAELEDMRNDLDQQRALADGRLPAEMERVMVEKRFDSLYAHLSALDRALRTLFSSKLCSYRQIQSLLRQATIARNAAVQSARGPSNNGTPIATPDQPGPERLQATAISGSDGRIESFQRMDLNLGRGLDVGTSTICAAASRKDGGAMATTLQRNAFLEVTVDPVARRLEKYGLHYVVRGERGYIIGDPAFEFAHLFALNLRRPMKQGKIASDEPDAILILDHLVESSLGPPQKPGEICVYSIPGEPIDDDCNFIYHRSALETVLSNLGYTPRPMLESHLIVFAELKEQDYTGIGLSCGGGMVNVCVAYKGVPTLAFSTMRAGDWIDGSVAGALGLPASATCAVKEAGMDLANPRGRVQEAVAIYYRHFIRYTLEMMKRKMEGAQNMPMFAKPLHLVFAGGTAMIAGFIDMVREEFDKVDFPIDVSDIRLAADPLKAVAAGCLQAAVAETRALGESPDDIAPVVLERAAVGGTRTTVSQDASQRARLQPAPA